MNVELRQIRHAVAVARHASFARAAAELHLSQSALSRSVQALELQIGTPIFVRSANGVLATDVGRLFLGRGLALLEMADRFDAQVLRNRTLQRGRLGVGAGPFAIETCVADATARFISQFPMVTVDLRSAAIADMPQPLRAHEIDLLVAEHHLFVDEPEFEVDVLASQPMALFGRAGHPLAGRRDLTLPEAFDHPLITLGRLPVSSLEKLLEAQRNCPTPMGRQRAFPAVQVVSPAVGRQVVLGSDALLPLPAAQAQVDVDTGRLVPVLALEGMATRFGIVHPKTRPLSAMAQVFCEQLRVAHAQSARRSSQLMDAWFH